MKCQSWSSPHHVMNDFRSTSIINSRVLETQGASKLFSARQAQQHSYRRSKDRMTAEAMDTWIAARSPVYNQVYYYNTRTRRSSWTQPLNGNIVEMPDDDDQSSPSNGVGSTHAVVAAPTTSNNENVIVNKDNYFIDVFDKKHNRIYYYNRHKRTSTWTNPRQLVLDDQTDGLKVQDTIQVRSDEANVALHELPPHHAKNSFDATSSITSSSSSINSNPFESLVDPINNFHSTTTSAVSTESDYAPFRQRQSSHNFDSTISTAASVDSDYTALVQQHPTIEMNSESQQQQQHQRPPPIPKRPSNFDAPISNDRLNSDSSQKKSVPVAELKLGPSVQALTKQLDGDFDARTIVMDNRQRVEAIRNKLAMKALKASDLRQGKHLLNDDDTPKMASIVDQVVQQQRAKKKSITTNQYANTFGIAPPIDPEKEIEVPITRSKHIVSSNPFDSTERQRRQERASNEFKNKVEMEHVNRRNSLRRAISQRQVSMHEAKDHWESIHWLHHNIVKTETF